LGITDDVHPCSGVSRYLRNAGDFLVRRNVIIKVVVGAKGALNYVLVYEETEGTWVGPTRLTVTLGSSPYVAIYDGTVAAGYDYGYASGVVAYLEPNIQGRGWSNVTNFQAYGDKKKDHFGAALAIWKDISVVGAPQCEIGSGNTNQFQRSPVTGRWKMIQRIEEQNTSSYGTSVAMADGMVIIGAPEGLHESRGKAFVYVVD